MFAMTAPLDGICDALLNAKYSMERLKSGKTFHAIRLVDESAHEEAQYTSDLIDTARQCLITYTEALRNDRREKRQRYKANKKKRTTPTEILANKFAKMSI